MSVVKKLPDFFIFADTGDEPKSVYETVQRTKKSLEEVGIPLLIVKKSSKSLSEELKRKVEAGIRGIDCPPFYLATDSPTGGIVSRQCTSAWKVEVLDRKKKKLAGLNLKRPQHRKLRNVVDAWMGISVDEASRMRDSKDAWQKYTYPLIDMGWRRLDCVKYLQQIEQKASRSACSYCPFHSDAEWNRIKTEEPEAWNQAVEFEKWIHKKYDNGVQIAGLNGKPYLHRSRVPIESADFNSQLDLFGFDNECSGICGV
jgi:3'-phosphoadenosine 5'-phosphosulfate sulfotransferase (PAPS reductase)/FAD synthetase